VVAGIWQERVPDPVVETPVRVGRRAREILGGLSVRMSAQILQNLGHTRSGVKGMQFHPTPKGGGYLAPFTPLLV
jgi:hypothetical protein